MAEINKLFGFFRAPDNPLRVLRVPSPGANKTGSQANGRVQTLPPDHPPVAFMVPHAFLDAARSRRKGGGGCSAAAPPPRCSHQGHKGKWKDADNQGASCVGRFGMASLLNSNVSSLVIFGFALAPGLRHQLPGASSGGGGFDQALGGVVGVARGG
jgi:hypothetical protein